MKAEQPFEELSKQGMRVEVSPQTSKSSVSTVMNFTGESNTTAIYCMLRKL
jgi:hypothetical protein